MPVVSEEFLAQIGQLAETARQASAGRFGTSFIQRTPGVCGGRARVRNTRIPVWTIVQMVRLGRAEADVLVDLPTLIEPDFDAVWSYYRQYPMEIENDIAQNNDELI